MAHVLGIAGHSPDQVLEFLMKRSVISEMSKVAIVPFSTKLAVNSKPVRSILFIIAISDFFRNLEVINSKRYSATQIFVFASPLRLNELENCVPLDYEASTILQGVGFALLKDISFTLYRKSVQTESGPIKKLEVGYLDRLTENAKRGSLLNPLMTFIYTLPGAICQNFVKESIAMYLYRGHSLGHLSRIFSESKDVDLSLKHLTRIRDILVSEIGDNYRKAFKELSTVPISHQTLHLPKICKNNNTSEYEMSYIKSIIEANPERRISERRS